ncbi:hypothetical protein DENSPDRAFT_851493 [Dentipellis sp. KUC8613]|nr:hypothetical protein DENSPDRAFT_851493 [Dentipellis sp. KUC8613]
MASISPESHLKRRRYNYSSAQSTIPLPAPHDTNASGRVEAKDWLTTVLDSESVVAMSLSPSPIAGVFLVAASRDVLRAMVGRASRLPTAPRQERARLPPPPPVVPDTTPSSSARACEPGDEAADSRRAPGWQRPSSLGGHGSPAQPFAAQRPARFGHHRVRRQSGELVSTLRGLVKLAMQKLQWM